MKQEVANQVNLWENACDEHAEKQLHNPFSEWSGEPPKAVPSPKIIQPKYFFPPGDLTPKTIPKPTFYPAGELAQPEVPDQTYYPSGTASNKNIHPKYFYPPGGLSPSTIQPKNFYPVEGDSTRIHPKFFYPPEAFSREASPKPPTPHPTTQPNTHAKYSDLAQVQTRKPVQQENYFPLPEPYPQTVNPNYLYQEDPSQKTVSSQDSYYQSGGQSGGGLSTRRSELSQTTQESSQTLYTTSSSSRTTSTTTGGFLAQVRKWRQPGSEPQEELYPLTQIPEPAKPAEPIRVKTPVPEEVPYIPQVEYMQVPQKEYFNIPGNQVIPDEVAEALPGWNPMGRSFADNVGGEQTISEDFYIKNQQQQEQTSVEYNFATGNWETPVIVTPQATEPEDMTYTYKNMSSQINLWQERAEEHQKKQLINPFSDWEGAPCSSKQSIIGLRLGRLGALTKDDPNYGTPVEGSKSDIRGKKAGKHISQEILDLCQNITDLGVTLRDKSVIIKFGALFQAYTRISNKLVGMLMRARKQDLLHFEGEMLYQGRDDEVVIKLLKAVERRQTTESVAGIESASGDAAARGSGRVPADIKIAASGEEAFSATGASPEEMLSKRESANMMMNRGSSINSSSMMNEESSMSSMQEESLGSSKMMASSSNSSQMMSKEDGDFSTKMLAGSSNSSKMMSKEESSTSTKMLSESSSSMKMLKEEGSLSTQMLGEGGIGDRMMLAGGTLSPDVTQESLMDSMKSGDIFNSMKMVPSNGNTSLMSKNDMGGALSNMASSEMMSSQKSSSSSSMMSKQMSTEQMSMGGSDQMTSAMENMSMSSAESNQTKMSQMSSASEQMSMASEQMSMSSNQMSSSSSQMKQLSDVSSMSSGDLISSDMMSSLMDDPFGKMVGTMGSMGSTTSNSVRKSSQSSTSSKQLLSKTMSSFDSSSDSTLLDDAQSLLSSDLADFKQLT